MADTVKSASNETSNNQNHILNRLEQYAEENPEKREYRITSELEAEQLLLAMAAILRSQARGMDDLKDARVLTQYAHIYKQKVQRNMAMEYIRELGEEESLYLFGLKLTVSPIVLQ